MVRYTVLWRKELIEELATLWMNYPGREQFSTAADRIDVELSTDPHLKGMFLPVGKRVIASGPISAAFRVDEADRKVFVEKIWLTESN